MNKFIAGFAGLAITVCAPAVAAHHAKPSHNSQTAQADQSTTADDQAKSVPSDLTGQKIYTSTNNVVGTVASMSKDAQGQTAAVVSTEQRLGIGSQKVLLPVSQLQARENGGGYYTNMTLSQVRNLPKAP